MYPKYMIVVHVLMTKRSIRLHLQDKYISSEYTTARIKPEQTGAEL